MEKREREKRRKNIIIRGVEVKEGKKKEVIERIMKDIGADVRVKEIKRLGRDREKDRKMVWLRLEDEEQRREVLRKKSRLRGRKERIMEDWTWEERR